MEKATSNLKADIKELRIDAREQLRTERISGILADQGFLQKDLASSVKQIERQTAAVDGAKYDLADLDGAHPEFTYKKEAGESKVKTNEEVLKDMNKSKEGLEKEIAALDTKIEETENGTWKCSLSRLNEMTDKMVAKLV